jgi:hypothetical protein
MSGIEAILNALKNHDGELEPENLYNIAERNSRISRKGVRNARYRLVLDGHINWISSRRVYRLTASGWKEIDKLATKRVHPVSDVYPATQMHPISEIYNYIDSGTLGVYILSRDGRKVHYVGRSDSNLKGRLKQSIREGTGYRFFKFKYVYSPMRAYHQECKWWHKYSPPDNSVHPKVPDETNWRCPIKSCEWG